MNPLKLAVLSLTRKRISTLIAVVSIALAVACGGLLLRLYLLSTSRFDSIPTEFDSVIGAKSSGIDILLNSLHSEGDYPGFIPYRLYLTLKSGQTVGFEDGQKAQNSFIKNIVPLVYFGLLKDFRVVGTERNLIEICNLKFTEGLWPSSTNEVAIGANVASSLGIHLGDTIEVLPWLANSHISAHLTFKISGILGHSGKVWDNQIFSSVEAAHKFFAQDLESMRNHSIWGAEVLQYFLIQTNANGFLALENLINKRSVAQVIGVDQEIERLKSFIGIGKYLGLLVSVFVIVLGGLSVSGILITRFDAMTAQLAVMRAIGFGKKQITQWLICEGFLLGLVGCTLGALLDLCFFPVFRSLLASALPASQLANSNILQKFPVWWAAGLATLAAVFIPVYRAFSQDVHDSLRGY